MMLFTQPEILIFIVMRTSGLIKEFVLISFIKPDVRKIINRDYKYSNVYFPLALINVLPEMQAACICNSFYSVI